MKKIVLSLALVLFYSSCGDGLIVEDPTSNPVTAPTSDSSSSRTWKYTFGVAFVFPNGDLDGIVAGGSSGSINGDNDGSNGIEEADAICNDDSNRPDVNLNYKALISDGVNRGGCTANNCSAAIDWPLAPSTEYRQSNGVTVIGTTTTNSIFTFPLGAAPYSGASLLTGLNADYTSSVNDCTNWTDGTAGSQMVRGNGGLTTSGAIVFTTMGCSSNPSYMLCVEQ